MNQSALAVGLILLLSVPIPASIPRQEVTPAQISSFHLGGSVHVIQMPTEGSVMNMALSAGPDGLLLLPLAASAQELFDLVPLAEGIYAAVAKPMVPVNNAVVIINSDDVLIVDTHASPASARALVAQIKTLTDKPVRYVVNTHWHTDHILGNRAYFEAFPAGVEFISHHTTREDIQTLALKQVPVTLEFLTRFIATAEKQLVSGLDEHDRPLTEEQKLRLQAYIETHKPSLEELREIQFILPTLTFERSLVLHRDGRPIHILYFFKGHTRGDVVVYLPREKVVVTGDLLTTPQLYVGSTSYPAQWVKSLRALALLDFEHVVPGHGRVHQGKDYLRLITQMLEALVEQVRAAIEQGLSLEDTRKRVELGAVRARLTGGDPKKKEWFDQALAFQNNAVQRAYEELSGKTEEKKKP